MKKYLLPLALVLLVFLGACSQKTNVSQVESTPRPQNIVIRDEMPKMIIIDTIIRQDSSSEGDNPKDIEIPIPIEITTGWGGPPCHPWAPYCIGVSCPCCNVCIIPPPPIVPWWPDISITSIQWSCIAWQPDCLPDPDVTFFEPSAGMLLHLKTWQDVTGVMHRPIVANFCTAAGFTFIGDIV